jgi:hypothetical protein
MSTLLIILMNLSMTVNPVKQAPGSAGTDLTIQLGFQNGGRHTVDGGRIGVGMLTSSQGGSRWAYELSFVWDDDDCHYNANDRYCRSEMALQAYGGYHKDFFPFNSKQIVVFVSGGVFLGLANYSWDHYDDNYIYDDYYGDDDTCIVGGVMGKAGIAFSTGKWRFGIGMIAGLGPSIGSESGLEIYFPVGGHFLLNYSF